MSSLSVISRGKAEQAEHVVDLDWRMEIYLYCFPPFAAAASTFFSCMPHCDYQFTRAFHSFFILYIQIAHSAWLKKYWWKPSDILYPIDLLANNFFIFTFLYFFIPLHITNHIVFMENGKQPDE